MTKTAYLTASPKDEKFCDDEDGARQKVHDDGEENLYDKRNFYDDNDKKFCDGDFHHGGDKINDNRKIYDGGAEKLLFDGKLFDGMAPDEQFNTTENLTTTTNNFTTKAAKIILTMTTI